MRRDHPTELRADLQRYYGLNVDAMGRDFTANHAAACAACLPMGSATLAAYEPALRWTWTEHKLHELESILARRLLPYPWDKAAPSSVEFEAAPVDELMEWLASKQH